MKLLIFDLDGTLYQFKAGSFRDSGLNKKVRENLVELISNLDNCPLSQAEDKMLSLEKKYREHFSLAMEDTYGMDRFEYFAKVWNIPAKGYIKPNENLRNSLLNLKDKYELVVISDAPRIWVENVLKELNIIDLFSQVFTGEGDIRKAFGNSFKAIIAKLGYLPDQVISIGDQEETDIKPAKELGIKTIFINKDRKSEIADFSVENISQIDQVLT